MQNVPQPNYEIPNYSNYQPEQEQLRLRKRLGDLLRLGAATPETFQQTILQIFQEAERQRQACMTAAEEHLRKYHQFNSQAAAFSMFSSIAYSVINGYVTIEERRAVELAERAKEKAKEQAEAAREQEEAGSAEANGVAAHEGAEASLPPEEAPSPRGGRRKKP